MNKRIVLNQMFSGVWIPREVVLDATLSPLGKLLFSVIQSLDGGDGCSASNSYISTIIGADERYLRRLLSELEDRGLIIRVEAPDGSRLIKTSVTAALEKTIVQQGGEGEKDRGGRVKKTPPASYKDSKEDITIPPTPLEGGLDSDRKPRAEKVEYVVHESELPFQSDRFKTAWRDWVRFRAEAKKKMTPMTASRQLAVLKAFGEENSIASIEQSIRNGWQGLFEVKQSFQRQQPTKRLLTDDDHAKGF